MDYPLHCEHQRVGLAVNTFWIHFQNTECGRPVLYPLCDFLCVRERDGWILYTYNIKNHLKRSQIGLLCKWVSQGSLAHTQHPPQGYAMGKVRNYDYYDRRRRFPGPIVDAGALVMHSARHQRAHTGMQLTHTPAQFHPRVLCAWIFLSFTWCVIARSIFDFG